MECLELYGRRRRKSIPHHPASALIGTLIVAGLYLALNATFLKVASLSEMAGQIDIGHIAARHIFGEMGGRIMSGLICIGLVSAISAMTWIGPRVAAVMGEHNRLLAPLARRSREGVPVAALIMQYVIIVVLLLSAAFEQVLTYVQFSLTLSSFLTVLGVMVLRWREPHLTRPYKTWGYPVTPIVFMVISIWVLVHVAQSNPRESLAGLGTLLLGLLIYFASRTRGENYRTALENRNLPNPPSLSNNRKMPWSRRRDSNLRPAVYETAALPLSYVGVYTGRKDHFRDSSLTHCIP